MYRSKLRKRRGHSLAELGPALFLILIVMVLPMACLASIGMRYTFFFYATRQAAREASKCGSFIADTSAYQLSAKNRALQVMNLFANSGGANGLKLNAIRTYVDVCNIGTGAKQRYGPTSAIPAGTTIDTINNVYNVTVEADGEIRPLIIGGAKWFGNGGGVPGLTKSFPVSMASASMCEKPTGMKQ